MKEFFLANKITVYVLAVLFSTVVIVTTVVTVKVINDNKPISEKIIGTWEAKNQNTLIGTLQDAVYYKFAGDSCEMGVKNQYMFISFGREAYKIDNNMIYIGPNSEGYQIVSINSSNLIWIMDGDTQVILTKTE